jgi:hypothetical protein
MPCGGSRSCARHFLALLLAIWLQSAGAAPQAQAVAGLQPDRRPAAPVVTEVARTGEWYARAFTGIALPYPWSLRFVNEQGSWHTPFREPGMTGKYDLRGWHGQGASPGREGNIRN